MVIEITENDFEKEVMKSDIPVIIDFFADWCGPCQMMKPVFEKISKNSGLSINQLEDELKRRAELLKKLEQQKVFDFKLINTIVNNYYQNPAKVLAEYGIK